MEEELRLACQEILFPLLGSLLTLLIFRHMCLLLLINKHNEAVNMLTSSGDDLPSVSQFCNI